MTVNQVLETGKGMNTIYSELLSFLTGQAVKKLTEVIEEELDKLFKHGAKPDELVLERFSRNEYLLIWEPKQIGYLIKAVFGENSITFVAEPFDLNRGRKA